MQKLCEMMLSEHFFFNFSSNVEQMQSIIKETDAIDSTGKSTKDDEEEGRKVVRKKGPNGFDPSPSSDISNLIENLTELDRRLTTMVFQRRFRAAKVGVYFI